MLTFDVIEKCKEKIENLDYSDPRKAFLDFLHYNRHLQAHLQVVSKIQKLYDDISSLNTLIHHALSIKKDGFEDYNKMNFNFYRERMKKNCDQLTASLKELNEMPNPIIYTDGNGNEFVEFSEEKTSE